MTVTLRDVAQHAGVSSATVSYVINSGPRPVSSETRARVLQAIEQLGYQPNAVARSLRLNRTSILGLILPDTNNPYFTEVARGIEQVAFDNGYRVILLHSGYDEVHERQFVDLLQAERVAGVIWIPATPNPETYQKFVSNNLPTVVFDRNLPGANVPNLEPASVVTDNFHGGYLATEHLLQLGHRRIACIARPVEMSHSQGRLRGYQQALQDYGVPFEPGLICRGGFRLENGWQATLDLLDSDPRVTAIFAYNDMMAIGCLRALYERGIRVPQDFSVIGFDDIPQAAYTCPSLTTIYIDKTEMGRRGAQLLLAMIEEKKPEPELLLPMEVRLVKRESTAQACSG
jgi:LacI family transcriptional regulator